VRPDPTDTAISCRVDWTDWKTGCQIGTLLEGSPPRTSRGSSGFVRGALDLQEPFGVERYVAAIKALRAGDTTTFAAILERVANDARTMISADCPNRARGFAFTMADKQRSSPEAAQTSGPEGSGSAPHPA
jgi:hypothetical protein